jgi:hypothetical protein
MTFGGMAAWQAWLLIAGAAGAALGLFLIKLRPPRVVVPSLLLWRRVLDEARDVTWWERIRKAVSLAVTIFIALTLALAVTRPRPRAGQSSSPDARRLIVIDSSWSMLARTSSGERRWDRARAEARRLVASGGEIALATTADGVVEGPTPDMVLLETALDRLAPAGGETGAWPRLAGAESVHFITDGAIARPLEAGVVVHSVFETAANVAITALDVRPSVGTATAGDAYLEITNFAQSAQNVRVTLERGSTSVLDRRFDMAAGESLRQVIPLARGADAMLRAHVDGPQNALEIDDEAYGWIAGARPLGVLVVSQQPEWLRALLKSDPGVRSIAIDPSSFRPPQDDVDVVIFDRWAPADPPGRPALCFAPPVDTPWLSKGTAGTTASPEERKPRWEIPGSHPLVRGVDPFTLIIGKARGYGSAALVPVAQSVRGTPLVAAAESAEQRLVVVTFGPSESNLTAAPAFPVLVGNALEWLARPIAGRARRPGPVVFDSAVASVTGPKGDAVPLVRVNEGAVAVLRSPGVYLADGGGARSRVVVNVGDPQLSNLSRSGPAATRNTRSVAAGMSPYPWWVYCVVAAFVLALVEWWTWQRRITV